MSDAALPGELNGHAVGIVMKEAVRRAIVAIRRQLRTFEAHEKNASDKVQDFVTSADSEAQRVYLRTIQECFPSYGVVAEEDHLRLSCKLPGQDLYFTIDPLDGTKAFMRRQSHAIGTMISLIGDGKALAAYVGDVMTQEIYGYRPGSEKVHRISEFNEAERLIIPKRPIGEQYVSLRSEPLDFSETVQRLARSKRHGGLFKSMEVSGGSIGVDVARLWKGEIGALVLEPFVNTPWDYCPVMGISEHLGFVEVQIQGPTLAVVAPRYSSKHIRRDYEAILIHESNLEELLEASR